MDEVLQRWMEDCQRAEEERDRYREALERIRDEPGMALDGGSTPDRIRVLYHKDIARCALDVNVYS